MAALQLSGMQFMKQFCDSRADPDPFLQNIGMQFIRYNTVCHLAAGVEAQQPKAALRATPASLQVATPKSKVAPLPTPAKPAQLEICSFFAKADLAEGDRIPRRYAIYQVHES